MSAPVEAGRHVFRVVNLGPEPDEVALVKLGPGGVLEDILAWVEDVESPPPAFENHGAVNALATGTEAYFEADLTPGDFMLRCFVTAPDGRKHVEHGMVRQFRIEQRR